MSALAGVVEDDDPPLTFALLVNTEPGTPVPADLGDLQQEVAEVLASWPDVRPGGPRTGDCRWLSEGCRCSRSGTVLVPSAGLPLHVFEPRYRALVRDCLAADKEFGVVLIERGSEVGGEDVRTDAGTVARIIEAVGAARRPLGARRPSASRRLRVAAGCPTTPTRWPRCTTGPIRRRATGSATRSATCVGLLRHALGLARRRATPAARATVELRRDPVLASYQAIAVAPFGPFDRQRLLVADTPDQRVAELADLLREAIAVLELRLGGSDSG